MNYILPGKGILPMHCAANVGMQGDTALFFGLSGTGKTTLSSDLDRKLVGDDEHGWSDHGIFNYEGGCYAKTIRLRKELEPVIWKAAHSFGSVLENVAMDPITRLIDFDNSQITENTRAAYPIHYVDNYVESGCALQPRNIFFLSADAFGVLPPISKLTYDQAAYYFLSGYTAKIAGTETGITKEPTATFSTCFAAPFLPLNPRIYTQMLLDYLNRFKSDVWLINTGWTGGKYGYGTRIPLANTRAMIHAVLNGNLEGSPMRKETWFNLSVPVNCPGVPEKLLSPVDTWKDKNGYRETAHLLIERFMKNFDKYRSTVPVSVVESGPHFD